MKYRAGNFSDTYFLLTRAMKYSSEANFIVHLFRAYVAVLDSREGLVAKDLEEFYRIRKLRDRDGDLNGFSGDELLWFDAYAEYMHVGCMQLGFDLSYDFKSIEPADLDKIDFKSVRILFKKMFPTYQARNIRRALTIRKSGTLGKPRKNQEIKIED